MTRKITQIKIWKSTDKKETRIYISFDGSHTTNNSGCYYLTGNRWNAKGTLEGITSEEKQAAWKIVQRNNGNDGKWHTVYENEI